MSAADRRCVRCGGLVDPKGVDERRYCFCVCRWPVISEGTSREVRGCGVRIYFIVNANERTQPFTLETGRPHHGECPAFGEMKRRERGESERTCPACGGARSDLKACRHCGWTPPGTAVPRPAADLRRFA